MLVGDRPAGESLLKESLNLGQKVVTIRDNRDLVQHILTTLNRITGAERSAIFLLEEEEGTPRPILRASKNLTSEQVVHRSFASSLKIIEEVARAGKGRILTRRNPREGSGPESDVIGPDLRAHDSRDKTVGVLYPTTGFSPAPSESDLDSCPISRPWRPRPGQRPAYEEIQRLNRKLSEENLYYKEEHLQNLHFEDIIGESPGFAVFLPRSTRSPGRTRR